MEKIGIGVIGGSGIYKLDAVKVLEEKVIQTPFGDPSDAIVIGQIGDRKAAFLPRHGVGHRLSPSEVPSKANIYAFKSLGVEKVISISAVGSLKEEIRPTDLVLPSQIIDRTKGRDSTFFGGGIVGHVAFADPFCEKMRGEVGVIIRDYLKAHQPDKRLHSDEIYVCMEGPQFSTRAESNLHRSWGAGVIGMTAVPEAKLAREAEMCYVTIALSTDYDCWKEEEDAVDVSMVVQYMKENNKTINALLPLIIQNIDLEHDCECQHAAEFAVMTAPEYRDEDAMDKLDLLYGKYWRDSCPS